MASILNLSMAQKPSNPADPELNFPKLLNREISVGSREFDPLIREPNKRDWVSRCVSIAPRGPVFRVFASRGRLGFSGSDTGSVVLRCSTLALRVAHGYKIALWRPMLSHWMRFPGA